MKIVFVIIVVGGFVYLLIPRKNSVRLYSKALDEARTFLVHLPEGYDKSQEKYPVLYLLDGGDTPLSSQYVTPYSHAVTTLKRLESSIPQMIMIGIANKDRCRDMLPVKIEEYPTSGGADKFLTFMVEELIPFVDRNFRTSDFRILYGESDAGLFTVYALLTHPGTFSAYIASSPTLGWCPGVITDKAKALLAKKKQLKKFFYIIYGENDPPFITTTVPSFADQIKAAEPKEFQWVVKIIKNQGHVPPRSLYDGLKFIFSFHKE